METETKETKNLEDLLESIGKKDTIVVNFFAGPGARKSTMCAHTFAELKWNDIDCEVALEYAKDKVWEESYKVFDSQLYILGKQFHRVNRLSGKVDVILTDSPLLLSLVYDQSKDPAFAQTVMNHFNKFRNVNYYVERRSNYNPNGRFQTEEGAKEVDNSVRIMLDSNNIKYKVVEGVRESVPLVVDDILKMLGESKWNQ